MKNRKRDAAYRLKAPQRVSPLDSDNPVPPPMERTAFHPSANALGMAAFSMRRKPGGGRGSELLSI
jgi:hypothetical protein